MTTPLCKVCTKPLAEHEPEDLNVCVAKDKGHKVETKIQHYDYRGESPKLKYMYQIVGNFGIKPLAHYSTDIRDAMPLWKDSWTVRKINNRYFIWRADTPLAEADELATALCHATLIEAKGDE